MFGLSISGSICLVLTRSCPMQLVCPGCFFFCCHLLVLISTFQNMRSSMLSFGSRVGKELNVLNVVVLNARASIGFTFRTVLLFIVLQLCNSCCFFFKSQSWFVLQQMEFSFGCLARQVAEFDLVICSLSFSLSLILLYLLLLQSPPYKYSFWLF